MIIYKRNEKLNSLTVKKKQKTKGPNTKTFSSRKRSKIKGSSSTNARINAIVMTAELYEDPSEFVLDLCKNLNIKHEGKSLSNLVKEYVKKTKQNYHDSWMTIKFETRKYYGEVVKRKDERDGTYLHIPNGFGNMIFKNKAIYTGQFQNGIINGNGTLECQNKISITSNWKNGVMDGATILKECGRIIFKGNYSLGLREGYGVENSSERNYTGQYKNDLPDGEGTLKVRDGFYKGDFKNGLKDGYGTFYRISGIEYKYAWYFRKEPHWLKKHYKYTIQKGLWKKDLFVCDMVEKKKQICVQNFRDTHCPKTLQSMTTLDMKKYLKNEYNLNIIKKRIKRRHVIDILKQKYQKPLENNFDDSFDLFGNEIKNPVLGSDGETYDLSSMEYLFEKSNGRYKNIPYIYENYTRTPNFPIMCNGKTLSFYFKNDTKYF